MPKTGIALAAAEPRFALVPQLALLGHHLAGLRISGPALLREIGIV